MYFSAKNLTGGYGGVNIIEECCFEVNQGEIVSILGPNGAGKSTAMKAMLGILDLKYGEVILDGQDITRLKTQDRIKAGISFVPQTNNIFTELTVRENLEMGAFLIDGDISSTISENKYYFGLNKFINEVADEILNDVMRYASSSTKMSSQFIKIL